MDQELKNIIVEQNKDLIKNNLSLLISFIDNLNATCNDIYEKNKILICKFKI